MIKLVPSLLFLIGSVLAAFCPSEPITSITLGGNLPNGATNLTDVPQGTNCTFVFDIPNNYNLKLSFNAQAGSTNDRVIICDNNNNPLYTLQITENPVYNIPLYLPARAASVRVEGVSGNMKFMLSYLYQNLDHYKQVLKKTGEHFPLTTVAANTYVTITASSANEKVVLSPASKPGTDDAILENLYVFDGDNINTAKVMGRLSDFRSIRTSSGQSVSIVNFAGVPSESYVLGNDASTLAGFEKYTVLLTSSGTSMSGNMTDLTGSANGSAYTWICTDCSIFYWTDLKFDIFATIADKAYVSFQGQTPTHKREKLIRYEAAFHVNNFNDDTNWKKVYPGRKGYIFAPSLWGTVDNNFNYEFRDDSRWYNFSVNLNKLILPTNGDQMTLRIGSGNGAPTLNNKYPTTQIPNSQVAAEGTYMQVGLAASDTADVRLFFTMEETQPIATTSTVQSTSTLPTKSSSTVITSTVQTTSKVQSSSTLQTKSSSTVTTSIVQTSPSTVQTTTSGVGDNDFKMLISIAVLMILV